MRFRMMSQECDSDLDLMPQLKGTGTKRNEREFLSHLHSCQSPKTSDLQVNDSNTFKQPSKQGQEHDEGPLPLLHSLYDSTAHFRLLRLKNISTRIRVRKQSSHHKMMAPQINLQCCPTS